MLLLTVEHCAVVDRIQSLHSIVQIWDDSPAYFVICDDEVGQSKGHQIFECKNQNWVPAVSCKQDNLKHFETESNQQRGKIMFMNNRLKIH